MNKLFLISFLLILSILIVYVEQTNMIINVLGEIIKTEISKSPIDHIIVISQGKRSFDNYFGTFPGVHGITNNTRIGSGPFSPGLIEYTVSVWFKTSYNFSETAMIINKGGLGSDKIGKNMNLGIFMTKNEKISAGFETTNGTDYFIRSVNKYNDGKWHNIVLSVNQTFLRLIIDGKENEIKNITGVFPSSNYYPLRIGSNFPTPEKFFVGDIDELRIWNRSLPNEEIITNYKNNKFDNNKLLMYEEFNREFNSTLKKDRKDYLSLNGSNFRDLDLKAIQTQWISPFKLKSPETDSPSDNFDIFLNSYHGGKMDGFYVAQVLDGHKNPNLTMGYYDNESIPYYWKLASKFVLTDNFFSLPSGSFNFVDFMTNNLSSFKTNISSHEIKQNRTFLDILEMKNISWKIYIEDYNLRLEKNKTQINKQIDTNMLSLISKYNNKSTRHVDDLTNYFRDLNNKAFPNIAFIISTDSIESAPKNVYDGNKFVAGLTQALMKSNYWNNSAFIITYSEGGGWYDHIPPPSLEFGFRVPTMIISPYSKNNFIDHTFYSTISILKFIQDNFNLGYITDKIEKSNNLFNVFNFDQTPNKPITIKDIELAPLENNQLNDKEHIFIINILYLIIFVSIMIFFLIGYLIKKRF